MMKLLSIIENISKTFKVDKNKELQALKNINIRLKKIALLLNNLERKN